MMTRARSTVYAFLDESGDAGGNLRKGASPHFVLAMVETTDPENLRAELRRLRAALNLPAAFEFRYHDTRKVAVRAAFFVLLRSLDLRIRAAIVNKARLPHEAEAWGEQEMYEYAVGEMVKHSSVDELSEAILVIDGERKPRFVQRLRQYLSNIGRTQKRGRIFKAIVLKESKREDGLQFADMVAGVLAERTSHGESMYDDYVDSRLKVLLQLP
ncbi:MAG: DUF3800 domain-containing protein [Chloroflexi bacterium]|nr:DUF3800 domain-containing protein [Chloroflexota bacterium]